MAFQLRRGTNAERLGISPAEGEIIYVTDSQLSTVTITTIASGTLLTADTVHGLEPDQKLKYFNNSSNGFVEGTTYYVLQDGLNETQFKLSLTQDGSPITTFTNGSGLSLFLAVGPTDVYGVPYGYSINPIWVGDAKGTLGGLPAGAATLDELADVTIGFFDGNGIPLDDYQHIEYDGTTNQWRNVDDITVPGYANILSTTDSSSKTTGSLRTAGGLGVVKSAVIGEKLFVGNTTDSTSKDTGALVVTSGGLGVELAINGGTTITAGTSLSAGTSVSAGTTITAGTNITAGGDLAVNGGDITTTAGTLNIGSTTTNINMGGSSKTTFAGSIQVGNNYIRASDGEVNIVLDSNLQTNLQGDLKINGGDIKDNAGTTTISLTGSGNVTIAGDLKLSGNDIISSSNQTAITLSGNDVSMPNDLTVGREINLNGSQPFINFNTTNSEDGVNLIRGIRGNVSLDDKWFVGAGSTGDDDGYLLLAVSDNGNDAATGEQVIVRKYGGSGTAHSTPWDTETPIVAELKLLDINSNTSIPNSLTVGAGLIVDTDTLIVDATNNWVGIGIEPTAKLDVNGSARIRGTSLTVDGNLIVNGTTTTINSTTLTVDDKNIVLGDVSSPSDTTADGGGITLKGTTDKTILWNNTYDWWEFNQAVSATKLYAGYIQIANNDSNTISAGGGDLNLTAVGQVNVLTDLEVQGNFKTYDNFIRLNSDVVSTAPSENCGITIARGTSNDVYLRWNESTDRWQTTVDGTNYITVPNQNLDTNSDAIFASANIGNISIADGTNDNTITTLSGTMAITAANSTVDITGETTVIGNFRTTDNIFRLNYAVETGTPTTGNSGMAVRRGDLPDAQLVFNEAYGWWTATTSDGTPVDIFSSGKIIANSDLATNGRTIIFNNDDATPTSSDNMSLLVKRGTSPDVEIVWDEDQDRWQTTTNGTTYLNLPNQQLDTDSEVDFSAINLDSDTARINTSTTTLTSTSIANIFTFGISGWRTLKATVTMTDTVDNKYHCVEVLVLHDGTNAYITQYGEMMTSDAVASLSVDISSGLVRLRATPVSTNSTKIVVVGQLTAV